MNWTASGLNNTYAGGLFFHRPRRLNSRRCADFPGTAPCLACVGVSVALSVFCKINDIEHIVVVWKHIQIMVSYTAHGNRSLSIVL